MRSGEHAPQLLLPAAKCAGAVAEAHDVACTPSIVESPMPITTAAELFGIHCAAAGAAAPGPASTACAVEATGSEETTPRNNAAAAMRARFFTKKSPLSKSIEQAVPNLSARDLVPCERRRSALRYARARRNPDYEPWHRQSTTWLVVPGVTANIAWTMNVAWLADVRETTGVASDVSVAAFWLPASRLTLQL